MYDDPVVHWARLAYACRVYDDIDAVRSFVRKLLEQTVARQTSASLKIARRSCVAQRLGLPHLND